MKSYKQLFKEGFTFNGRDYCEDSYISNYHELVKDILDGVHGQIPSGKELKSMFRKTVYRELRQMPPSIIEKKLYQPLGDIYVTRSMGIGAINCAVKRISKIMGKDLVIH